MFFGEVFDLHAGAVAIAVHRAEDDVRPAKAFFELARAALQRTVVVVKLAPAALDKAAVEGFHALHPAHNEDTFLTKIKGGAGVVAGPAAAGFPADRGNDARTKRPSFAQEITNKAFLLLQTAVG